MKNKCTRICAFALIALALTSCGGGGSGGSPSSPSAGNDPSAGNEMTITPPSTVYGAYDWGSLGPACSDGWAIGVATGYSSASAAASAAMNECKRGGGGDCGPDVGTFGSAYSLACMAIWSGTNNDRCRLGQQHGMTQQAVQDAALAECRSDFSTCEIEVSKCSTTGPAESFFQIAAKSRIISSGLHGALSAGIALPSNAVPGDPHRCPYARRLVSGVSSGHISRKEAQEASLKQCEAAANGVVECSVLEEFGSAHRYACAALTYGENGERCALGDGAGNSRAEAEDIALADCYRTLRAGSFIRGPDGRLILDPNESARICRVVRSACGA